MRALAIIVAVAAVPGPPPGVYCSLSGELPAIVVAPEPGGIGVDGLDCQDAVVAGGRLRASRCYANGGTVVPYETGLNAPPDGDLVHEMEIYRRTPQAPCP